MEGPLIYESTYPTNNQCSYTRIFTEHLDPLY